MANEIERAVIAGVISRLTLTLGTLQRENSKKPDSKTIEWSENLRAAVEALEGFAFELRSAAGVADVETDMGKFLADLGRSISGAQASLDADAKRRLLEASAAPPDGAVKAELDTIYRIPKVSAQLKFALERKEGSKVNVVFYGKSSERKELHEQTLNCEVVAVSPPPGFIDRLRAVTNKIGSVEPPKAMKQMAAGGPKTKRSPQGELHLGLGERAVLEVSTGGAKKSRTLEVTLRAGTGPNMMRRVLRNAASTRKSESVKSLAAVIDRLSETRDRGAAKSQAALARLVLEPNVRETILEAAKSSTGAEELLANFRDAVIFRLGRSDSFFILLGFEREGERNLGIWFCALDTEKFDVIRSPGKSRSGAQAEDIVFGVDVLLEVAHFQRGLLPDEELG